mmetsp:Transcript_35912/g.112337  ORF Transcript_35912/g.112337 Transcript_35912/m.112337 type:complete len:241 (-) Transcript_35912:238-960(-)
MHYTLMLALDRLLSHRVPQPIGRAAVDDIVRPRHHHMFHEDVGDIIGLMVPLVLFPYPVHPSRQALPLQLFSAHDLCILRPSSQEAQPHSLLMPQGDLNEGRSSRSDPFHQPGPRSTNVRASFTSVGVASFQQHEDTMTPLIHMELNMLYSLWVQLPSFPVEDSPMFPLHEEAAVDVFDAVGGGEEDKEVRPTPDDVEQLVLLVWPWRLCNCNVLSLDRHDRRLAHFRVAVYPHVGFSHV